MNALFDMHTHTDCSHDGKQTIAQLCQQAQAVGLAGVAVTDHGDSPYITPEALRTIARSARQAAENDRRATGGLTVLAGVEIGEECWARDAARALHEQADFDVILASIHGFWRGGAVHYYAVEPFDAAHYTADALQLFLQQYLSAMAENAAVADYDILAHLDCPLRYINGKYHRGADILRFPTLIDDILRTVIRRGKTLEINTSGLAGDWGQRMPQEAIVRRYYALGGRHISLGSDAHCSANVAVGFAQTAAALADMGFAGETVYDKRQPVLLPWETASNG